VSYISLHGGKCRRTEVTSNLVKRSSRGQANNGSSGSSRLKDHVTAETEEFQQRGDTSKAVHVFIRSMLFQPWSSHLQYKTEGRCQSCCIILDCKMRLRPQSNRTSHKLTVPLYLQHLCIFGLYGAIQMLLLLLLLLQRTLLVAKCDSN